MQFTLWALLAIYSLAPNLDVARADELSEAIGEASESHEDVALLVSIAWWETARTFDLAPVGDSGHSVSPWQLWICPGPLCKALSTDLKAAAKEALKRARASIARCRRLTPANRLSEYTTGKCQTNREARMRWNTARRLLLQMDSPESFVPVSTQGGST